MFRIGPPTRLAYDAVQEIRIKYRWEALDQENEAIKAAKTIGKTFDPELLENGDTLKQLLARSRYLLFKHRDKWTASQLKRAKLLFERYPVINQAYNLSLKLGTIFQNYTSKELAYKPLAFWYDDVEKSGLESFRTVAKSIESHYVEILNRAASASSITGAQMLRQSPSTLKSRRSDPHPQELGIFHSSFSDYPNFMLEIVISFPPRIWLDPLLTWFGATVASALPRRGCPGCAPRWFAIQARDREVKGHAPGQTWAVPPGKVGRAA